jgi:pimeloyl-ACP methyl ester carboxylesterase
MKIRRVGLVVALGLLFVLCGLPYLIPLPAQPDFSADQLAGPDGRFVTVRGTRTWVQTAGPATGPAVILIHGFGGSTFSWRYTLPALAQVGDYAVALDLKGFGLADKTFDADYSHAAQADLVAQVMDALRIQKATVIGHSMGGSVAVHFARQYPDRVEKLVLVDAAVFESGGGNAAVADLLSVPPLRRWAQLAVRLYATPARSADMLKSAYFNPAFATPDILAGYLVPQQVKGWELALLGIMRDGSKNGLAASTLNRHSVPTLILWGQSDTWIPLSAGEKLHADIQGSELVVFPQAGHLPMEEQAAAFNARLIEFLRK